MKKLILTLILCLPLLTFAITDEERQEYMENSLELSNFHLLDTAGLTLFFDIHNIGNLKVVGIRYKVYFCDESHNPAAEKTCWNSFTGDELLKPNYSSSINCGLTQPCPTCVLERDNFIFEMQNIWFEGEEEIAHNDYFDYY